MTLINYYIHVLDGKESIFDVITKLPCLGDHENLEKGQLPVQKVLERRY